MKAGAAGGIEAVVKAINTHIDNPDVCEEGCGALWGMTEYNSNGKYIDNTTNKMKRTDENQVKAGKIGGNEAVVKAISIHINNVGVCEHGCRALLSLTCDNGKT